MRRFDCQRPGRVAHSLIITDDGNPPLEPAAQRALERDWSRVIVERGVDETADLRPFVRDSWARAIAARVEPGLRRAPLAASTDALGSLRESSPWLRVAQDEVSRQAALLGDSGLILSLFDADGQMVYADGDPHILDAMQEIHFMPGGLWSESAVGTNGPGTALSLGRPVHIIGAEHFCAGWQPWHCAALPIRDPVSGEIIGAIDLSGAREQVHPLALHMAIAIGRAVEHAISARSRARQGRLLAAFADVAARHPNQPVVAVDEARRIVAASPSAAELPRGPWQPGMPAILDEIAVRDDGQPAGACLVLETRAHKKLVWRAGGGIRYCLADLIGNDPRIAEARRIAAAAARNDLPVLVFGESGVGNEVVAQAIHAASTRATGPFVAVNCAAIPKDLLESELFGYVGGAFSGARASGSPGKIEAAAGGTLFLDEVLELGSAAQAALLRVLQEGELTRIGAVRAQAVDVRVIAATNRDVPAALASGALRRDFYHRLNVLSIALPPLRERGADFSLLLDDMLASACRELGRPPIAIAPEAVAPLASHTWPGNVRELKNLARRLVAMLRGERIELDDLPDELRDGSAALSAAALSTAAFAPALSAAAASGFDEQAPSYIPTDSVATGSPGSPGPTGALGFPAKLIAVVQTARTMSEAAARLGIDRSTLYRQLAKYGLRRKKTLAEQ